MVTTESGLQYKDIKIGDGPSPPIGFQVFVILPMERCFAWIGLLSLEGCQVWGK